jgi:hypothetical protein
MSKLINAIASIIGIIGLAMGNITFDNNSPSLGFNFSSAYADDICDIIECIQVTGSKPISEMRPSSVTINWRDWGTDA